MKFSSWSSWTSKLPKPERYLVIAFAAGIIISFGILAGNSFIANTSAAPAFGGAISAGFIGNPHYLNPVLAPANEVDRALVKILYPSLMRYSSEGKLLPYLAERFAIGEDGKVYDFFLKKKSLWDDGKPITAYDVAFTIKIIQDPNIRSPLSRVWEGVKVEAVSDTTVRFTLQEPYAFFLQNTTIEILPQHIWEKIDAENFPLSEYNKKPVGGGPYSFASFTKNDNTITSIDFKVNASFFGKPPYIQKFTARFYSQNEEAIRAYQQGEIDFLGVPFGSSSFVNSKNASDRLTIFFLPRYFAIFLNEKQNPALGKKSVREALLLAINRDEIISSLLNAQARKVYSPIPRVLDDYYTDDLPRYEFDREQAKELLSKAGFSDTKPLILELTAVQNELLAEVAQMIKQNWEEIGIKVSLRMIELSQLRDQVLQKRNYEGFLFGQALALEPDPFSLWHSSQSEYPGLNLASYKNPEVDKILEELRQNLDKGRQKELFKKFQTIVAKDLPALFLYSPYHLLLSRESIKGIISTPLSFPEDYLNQLPEWYMYTKRASK